MFILAQFRLTHKFAIDLKVSLQKSPEPRFHPLDDWIGDVFYLNRKKVAILTHVQTLISFIFPYREVGGAKNTLDFLSIEIELFLRHQNLEEWIESMKKVFNEPPTFAKTENRKALGYMNDFKRMVLCSRYYFDEETNWHKLSDSLKNSLVNVGGCYKTPTELLIQSLKRKVAVC